MANTWLITGIPGAGKTTVARLLAERLERAVVIEGDLLQGWIVSGNVWPGQEPAAESSRQIHLNMRNQCLLAQSYAGAGFTPIIAITSSSAKLTSASIDNSFEDWRFTLWCCIPAKAS